MLNATDLSMTSEEFKTKLQATSQRKLSILQRIHSLHQNDKMGRLPLLTELGNTDFELMELAALRVFRQLNTE